MLSTNIYKNLKYFRIHHGMVVLCFGIAVSTRTYVAYAALSLVVEINSVFLHARQLMTIGGLPKSSWIYRTNAIMNVSTFVLFRILLLGWMTRWLSTYGDIRVQGSNSRGGMDFQNRWGGPPKF